MSVLEIFTSYNEEQDMFEFKLAEVQPLLESTEQNSDSIIRPLILYSSGLESYTNLLLFRYLAERYPDKFARPGLVFFKYGSNAQQVEEYLTKKAAEDYQCELKIIDVRDYYRMLGVDIALLDQQYSNNDTEVEAESSSHYYPYRNSLFILTAAIYAEQSKKYNLIVLGGNLSESMTYGDNTREFILGASIVTRYGGIEYIDVSSPLINLLKTELIILGELLGANYNEYSSSCYYPKLEDGRIINCNKCGSCYLRQTAFERAKIKCNKFKLAF